MKKNIMKMFAMLLVVGLVTGCGCDKESGKKKSEEEGIKVNTNENVIKDQELEVFKFTNTSLIYENGTSVLETTVTNTSDQAQYLKEFKILVKNEAGEEIITLTGFIGDSIAAQETKTISSSYGDDLTKAASIEYSIVR